MATQVSKTESLLVTPRTWLFQANPERFDVGGFFATRPAEFLWLVRQHGSEIKVEDRVFAWRAIGSGDRDASGVMAEARVISPVAPMPEDPIAKPFWRGSAEGDVVQPRVRLGLLRAANKRQVIKRDWIAEDPILRDLAILRQPNATNFPVSPAQATRLTALWSRTGQDWTYPESVAGLWAYARTFGEPVSRLPGSIVAEVAVRIGRAVPGVYNKIMNFRAIDPRDTRTGMSGAAEMDRKVWRQFYDASAGELLLVALDEEYWRLWEATDELPAVLPQEQDDDFERELRGLTDYTLTELGALLQKPEHTHRGAPAARVMRTQQFERDPVVAALAKVRAGFRCEVPECPHATFEAEDGRPYTEVHHIDPLAEGGADTPENVACLCPAHHREVHYGRNAIAIRRQLNALRRALPPAETELVTVATTMA